MHLNNTVIVTNYTTHLFEFHIKNGKRPQQHKNRSITDLQNRSKQVKKEIYPFDCIDLSQKPLGTLMNWLHVQ